MEVAPGDHFPRPADSFGRIAYCDDPVGGVKLRACQCKPHQSLQTEKAIAVCCTESLPMRSVTQTCMSATCFSECVLALGDVRHMVFSQCEFRTCADRSHTRGGVHVCSPCVCARRIISCAADGACVASMDEDSDVPPERDRVISPGPGDPALGICTDVVLQGRYQMFVHAVSAHTANSLI